MLRFPDRGPRCPPIHSRSSLFRRVECFCWLVLLQFYGPREENLPLRRVPFEGPMSF